MGNPAMWPSNPSRIRPTLLLLAVALLTAAPASRLSAQAPAGVPQRGTAGKLATARGTLFYRETPQAEWQVVDSGADIYAGGGLVGLPGAVITSTNGAVSLEFQTDFDSPLPVLECALALHLNPAADLDFTLDRGRVDVTNRKDKGAAEVLLHSHGHTWQITLTEPGASIAVE